MIRSAVKRETRGGVRLGLGSPCLVLVAVLCLAGGGAEAAESWEVLLKSQLTEQQRCVLDKIISMRQIPIGAAVGLEGRIKCTDGREFDFKRDREHEKFTIRLCQPAVC